MVTCPVTCLHHGHMPCHLHHGHMPSSWSHALSHVLPSDNCSTVTPRLLSVEGEGEVVYLNQPLHAKCVSFVILKRKGNRSFFLSICLECCPFPYMCVVLTFFHNLFPLPMVWCFQFTNARSGQSLKLTPQPPIGPDSTTLVFESRFESGNLEKAVKV